MLEYKLDLGDTAIKMNTWALFEFGIKYPF